MTEEKPKPFTELTEEEKEKYYQHYLHRKEYDAQYRAKVPDARIYTWRALHGRAVKKDTREYLGKIMISNNYPSLDYTIKKIIKEWINLKENNKK